MNKTKPKPTFIETVEKGEIIKKSGYHQPGGRGGCTTCKRTTEKGAYRDVSVSLSGSTVHFYHQSPVVIEYSDFYQLDSCGYRTSTTKERINRHIPFGYKVIQQDYEWYLETPDGRTDFSDGMVIQK